MNSAMNIVLIFLTVYFGAALSSPAPAALGPDAPSLSAPAPLGTGSEPLPAPAARTLRAPGDLDTASTFGFYGYAHPAAYYGAGYGTGFGYGYGYPAYGYGGYYGAYRYPSYSGYLWG